MKKYYVYKTTNLINGKYYIGKHASEDMNNDQYLGSGILLKRSIKKYGKHNFRRQILGQFTTQEQAFSFQQSLVNQTTLCDQKCYNLVLGGYGFNQGYVIVSDDCGIHYRVKNNDERYLSGWLKSIHTGMVNVIDKSGNKFSVPNVDQRYLSGQLVSIVKGEVTVRDLADNTFRVKVDDPRYISGQLCQVNTGFSIILDQNGKRKRVPTNIKVEKNYKGIHSGRVTVKDKDGNIFHTNVDDPKYVSGQLVQQNKGKVVVKDKDGNTLSVFKDDPRYINGELVGTTKNSFWITNGVDSTTVYEGDIIPDGWKRGKTSHNIWITDGIKNKSVNKGATIPIGWRRGRTYNSHKK